MAQFTHRQFDIQTLIWKPRYFWPTLCTFWGKIGLFLVVSFGCLGQNSDNHLFELSISTRTKNTDLLRTRPLCLEFGKTFEVSNMGYLQSISVYYHYESNLKGQNAHGIGWVWYSVGKDDPNSAFLYQRFHFNFYQSPDYQQYSYLPGAGASTGVGYAIDENRSVLLGVNFSNDNWKPYLELAYHHVFYVPKKALMTRKMIYRRQMRCWR